MKTSNLLLLLPMLLLADDPRPGASKLGVWWNEDLKQLERLDGVPGSLQLVSESMREGVRYWTSSRLLISLEGGQLEVRDLDTGAVVSKVIDSAIDVVFSTDGSRWRPYDPASPKPFLLNDGTVLQRDGEVLAERNGILLSVASGALTEYEREGDGWKEIRRSEAPVFQDLLSMHVSGDSLLLLTRSGELIRWRGGEAESLASAVQGLEPLRQEGFFRLRGKTGSRLLYPDSPGQQVYELGAAQAPEVRQ